MNTQDLEPNLLSMRNAINVAMTQFQVFEDKCPRKDLIIVVNFREPSYRKRLAIVDVNTGDVLSYHHTSHGSGSADPRNLAKAVRFSNVKDSHMSSLGAMITAGTYIGKHGRSLKLKGLEPGINDKVESRYIVLHSADNMTDGYILANGRCPLSWGCFMLSPAIKDKVIDLVKGGCFLYAFY